MGCHGRREFKYKKYAALPLRMSPFPWCIFDNIEMVNVTKSRFLTFVARYKRNDVEYLLVWYVIIYFLEYNQWSLWIFKDVLNKCIFFFLSGTNCVNLPTFDDAVLIDREKDSYKSGEQVAFKCRSYYQLDGSNTIQCIKSKWIGRPACRGTLVKF